MRSSAGDALALEHLVGEQKEDWATPPIMPALKR